MYIVHTFWLPEAVEPPENFVQRGAFWLWAEHAEQAAAHSSPPPALAATTHPFHLRAADWPELLRTLGLSVLARAGSPAFADCQVCLPSQDGCPLPSPQLAALLGDTANGEQPPRLANWTLAAYRLVNPFRQFADLRFLLDNDPGRFRLGEDFLFWHWFLRQLRSLLMRDQYLPSPVYRQNAKSTRKRPPVLASAHLYGVWQWAGRTHARLLEQAVNSMPAAARAGCLPEPAGGECDRLADAESLLRHCAEVLLDGLVRDTHLPATFSKRFADTLLASCHGVPPGVAIWSGLNPQQTEERYRHWQSWRASIAGGDRADSFALGLRLAEPPADAVDDTDAQDAWRLEFILVPRDDPSSQLALSDYWVLEPAQQEALRARLGQDLERQVLFNLGLAARIYPKLWEGLETDKPQALSLSLEEAFAFLSDTAWVLEDAGFRIVVPAWWTPRGQRRLKIRLRTTPGTSKTASPLASASGLGLDNLVQYHYRLAVGDTALDDDEWQQLVAAKTPLVRLRGQWVLLDRDQMQQMLNFWQQHGQETATATLPELLQRTADDSGLFEIDRDDALARMLDGLRDSARLTPAETPAGMQATLRDYQRRGLAWLGYLERLGLNGCLADDMGLGKTIQVIARLVEERAAGAPVAPTLLIAPTSVLGNWRKEIERFAPMLATLTHHGGERERDPRVFAERAAGVALVITTYTIARRDLDLLSEVPWQRVVLDEAQNIKNPKAAQTKAVTRLPARHRLALTGTPVENRLTDLWSILHFLQPGYLGTQTQFRKRFELPVQRDRDPVRTATLKRLIEPFILRRVKTDKSIVRDLPDKIEARQYCQLSHEQGALYESLVRDVEVALEGSDGIARQGLILSTLMKLKQICNHPAQFLQDGSPFSVERSRKLQRLGEMLEEVMAEGDSALIFTQFTEIGERLERLLRQQWGYRVYYLHGGTPRARRERMIAEFQDPRTEPALFVLSLKAGGVGITLTKANHVFHFDRWWNPAVEDQASDRAFRIGQEKHVFVHQFVTVGTLEERIDALIESKRAIAGAIVGSDESWLAQLDNERFKELIRLNRTAVGD